MKLLYIPLAFLIAISIFSMLGLGTTDTYHGAEAAVDEAFVATTSGWYDANAHKVASMSESTVGIGEAGGLHVSSNRCYWMNATNVGTNGWKNMTAIKAAGTAVYNYPVFDLLEGDSLEGRAASTNTISFDTASSYGLIALIIGLMALAAIAGLKVFGTGISEISVSSIVKGTAFLSLWAMFSITSMGLILTIPAMMGMLFYFILTGIYTFGVINQIGSPGED